MKKVKIYFDAEEHKYTDNEGNAYTSVTQLIDKYKPKFNKDFWAWYRAIDQEYGMYGKPRPDMPDRIWCKRFRTDSGRYYTISELSSGILPMKKHPVKINYEWEKNAADACDRGNKEHDYLENCINNFYKEKEINETVSVGELPSFTFAIKNIETLKDSPLSKTHKSVFEVLKKLIKRGFTLFAEKRVYSYEHRISGMIDIIAVNDKSEFYIVDWKTNKDPLQFQSGYFKKVWNYNRTKKVKTDEWVDKDERMFEPLNDLQNCKGTLYSLQLSLYARICELWGLKCLGLILCHLRIEVQNSNLIYHEPIFYNISYLRDHVDKVLSREQKVEIKAKKKVSRKPLNY
tara:strand:- start:21399 stop:22433 length:1035 start_codon:yes stop_codon:yes gene_type:complete